MQFQVPQFIETEDKIVGPLTLKQFIYLAVAGLISFLLFFVLKLWLWLIFTIVLGLAAASLAFIKYHGRPLTVILLAAATYFWKPRFYLWKREAPKLPEIKLPKLPKAELAEEPKPLLKKMWLKLHTAVPSPAPKAPLLERFEILRKLTGERQAAKRVDYR